MTTTLFEYTNPENEEVLRIVSGNLNDNQDELSIEVNDRVVFTMGYEGAVHLANGIMGSCAPKVERRKRMVCPTCGSAVMVNNRLRVRDGCYVCPSCKVLMSGSVQYPSYKGVV